MDWDRPQYSLAVFALRPEQINSTSYTNRLDGSGKAHVQHAPKEGASKYRGFVRADIATMFSQELFPDVWR